MAPAAGATTAVTSPNYANITVADLEAMFNPEVKAEQEAEQEAQQAQLPPQQRQELEKLLAMLKRHA
jgi:hypothetical protein